MNNDYPKSVDDIKYYRHGYDGKKIWTILGMNKRLSGSLNLSDKSVSLDFELPREQVDSLKGKIVSKTTAVRDNRSRILLLSSNVWESPYSSIFRTGAGTMRLNPSLVVLQGSDKPITDKITNLTGYMPGIGEWFKENFLDFDHDEYKFKQKKRIYHEIPLGNAAKIILNGKLTIDLDSTIMDSKFLAYPESFVNIEFSSPRAISSAIDIFSHVENFFNFIFPTPHATHIFTSKIPSKAKIPPKAYILSPNRYKDYKREDVRKSTSMLFAWEDISNINDVFVQWILQYDRIHEIVDTLVLLKSVRLSEEVRFTNIINALEAVHRRYYDHKVQPDDEYKERLNKIISQVEEREDKLLVQKRLEYGNEITLRKRLQEVYAIGEQYGMDRPSSATTTNILDTRNYYTHGDEAKKSKALRSYGLSSVNSLLGRYLKVLLLEILGVDKTDLTNIVEKSPQLQPYYRDEPPTTSNFIF